MINFTRAFDSAWERMMVILFRPFDLGKWFVIGFSAFLAGFLSGGNGFNSSFNPGNLGKQTGSSNQPSMDFQQFNSQVSSVFASMQIGIIIVIFLIAFVFILAVSLVIYWLGARGQFLFLDNLVRNRGAIAGPWTAYANQGNSLFFFYLVFLLISIPLFLIILCLGLVLGIPLYLHHRWPEGLEIVGFVILGLLYFALALVLAVILFIFRELGVPLMFRNGLNARAAFWESMKLARQHPGSIALFVLLRFAIAIGVGVISLIACCFTCCIGMLPYIGTVIILPALVFVRCFTLDCLAQFGPQYNVWTVDVPPTQPVTGGLPSSIPPPPLG